MKRDDVEMAHKAYKFRLYPTKEQEQLLIKTFGCVRFVYNKMLSKWKETYEQFKNDKAALKKLKCGTRIHLSLTAIDAC
ncbi:hypothetical protein B4168_3641 [Anoxybacillus flavithermus]|nr:transposase, IS605 family [Parageobacillus thermoglucosidasius TNO-09.020]KYD12738.1 hypothetical protein B4168_3641 [Anoxybacillus flavithermus]